MGSSESAQSRKIRAALDRQELKKLCSTVYTSNLIDSPEQIVRRNLYYILGELFSGAILSHRTAIEGGPSIDGLIVLTYKYTKKVSLPGCTVRLVEGAGPQQGDTAFIGNLFIASRERAVLENLQSSRGVMSKVLSKVQLEEYLYKICRIHGEGELNKLRDQARELSVSLGLGKEFIKLDKLIAALLSSSASHTLHSLPAQARAKGRPYDAARIALFSKLVAKLSNAVMPMVADDNRSGERLKNMAFFEAYFSNFIEGTEFEVAEAKEIVFDNKIIHNRSDDAHDILGTFQIVASNHEMQQTPTSFQELLDLLSHRHHQLMAARTDKNPGRFKAIANRAGGTIFVAPDLVRGS